MLHALFFRMLVFRSSLILSFSLLAAVLVSGAGCNSDAPAEAEEAVVPMSDRLIGVWEIDKNSAENAIDQFAEEDGSFRARLKAKFYKRALKSLQAHVEFQSDGRWSLTASVKDNTSRSAGEWSCVGAKGSQVTILSKFEGKDDEQERAINFVDENTIEMPLLEEDRLPVPVAQALTFRRVMR